jgi:peptide/nickel transport system permease protein
MRPVVLLTDGFMFVVVAAALWYVWHVRRTPPLLANWRLALRRPAAMFSAVILMSFVVVALLDCLHYRPLLPADANGRQALSSDTRSVLDNILAPIASAAVQERTYSAPLAWLLYRKETFQRDGATVRDYPRLKFGGAHLKNPEAEWKGDVLNKTLQGLFFGALVALVLAALCVAWHAGSHKLGLAQAWRSIWRREADYPILLGLIPATLICLVLAPIVVLSSGYHVMGTSQVGASVLVSAVKSVRTAFVIGALTTIVVLPLGVVLGVMAGYFRGWVDELIQYVYTLLASIPDVLMIAAVVLLLQGYIDNNPAVFETSVERSDARLFFLCMILGVTSFTGLCRLVRGETLKLREMEYIQASQAFGVPALGVLSRHILPNIMHLLLITTVMQFSVFVLAEAVLSYVGVGVDPKTASFGVMINSARAELAAVPMVWWSLSSAFVLMFLLVLSANLFSDAVRDAFDPRTRLRK